MAAPTITRDMTFQQILKLDPRVAKLLASYHLGCAGCGGAKHETLAQGARAHGLDLEQLLRDLNALFEG